MRPTVGWRCVRTATFVPRGLRQTGGGYAERLTALHSLPWARLLELVLHPFPMGRNTNQNQNPQLLSSHTWGQRGSRICPLCPSGVPPSRGRGSLSSQTALLHASLKWVGGVGPLAPLRQPFPRHLLARLLWNETTFFLQGLACLFWTPAAELCSNRKKHNYSLRLEGNCEHLQSAFLFNTCLECLSRKDWKATCGWRRS